MFCPQDLVGLAGKSRGEVVYLNGRRAYQVKLHMVQFTREGMSRIGQGLREVSERYGLPVSRMKELMRDALFSVPPNPSLYFLFTIPELEADVHVEIPRKFWRFSQLATDEAPEFQATEIEPTGDQTATPAQAEAV